MAGGTSLQVEVTVDTGQAVGELNKLSSEMSKVGQNAGKGGGGDAFDAIGKSASSAAKEVSSFGQQATSSGKQAESGFSGIGKTLAGLGAAAAGTAVVGFMTDAVSAASDLEQAVGATDAVFKSSSQQIHDWAADTSDNINLSKSDFEGFAVQIGAQLKNAGVPMEELGGKTHDLIALAADLDAQFGGGTAKAVDTLAGALKGNIETLDNYGVSITQASVNAKVLELGLDTSTQAAEASAKQQATLAIIFEQTADAQGAAARESDSYATQQQKLGVAFDNLLASVGGPLLGALSGFANVLVSAAGAVQPLLVGVSSLVGWVGQLPGPVLAAGAAFAGWQLFGGKILEGWPDVKAKLGEFKDKLKDSVTSVSGFKSAAKGIFDAVGPGLAIGGAVAGIGLLVDVLGEAGKASKDAETAYGGVVSALVASGGVWDAHARQIENDTITNSDAFKGLVDAGVSASDAIEILSGNYALFQELERNGSPLSQNVTRTLEEQVGAMVDAHGATGKLSAARIEGNRILEEKQKAEADAGKSTADLAAENLAAISSTDALTTAYSQYKASVQDAAKNTTLQTTLDGVSSAAAQAKRDMEYLNIEIDKMTGRNPDVEKAGLAFQKLLNPPGKDQKSPFQAFAEGTPLAVKAINDWNTAIIDGIPSGQDFHQQLLDIADGAKSSNEAVLASALVSGTTADAMAALGKNMDDQRTKFLTWAQPLKDAGVDVEGLADKLGLVASTDLKPITIKAVMDDALAQEALRQLQGQELPIKTIKITADDTATKGVIESAITYTDQLTGKEHTIKLNADPTTAQEILTAVQNDINGTHGTVTLDANGQPVSAAVAAAKGQIDSTTGTITMEGNQAPARASASQAAAFADSTVGTIGIAGNASSAHATTDATIASIAARDDGVIRVPANTAPARNAVAALISDMSGSAITIAIHADTGPFYAAYNALPSSKAVTITTTQQTVIVPPAGAVPRLAPQGVGVQAFSAPSLQSQSTDGGVVTPGSTPGTAASINITVNGAVDPDSTARQIRAILRGRDRRVGAVVI